MHGRKNIKLVILVFIHLSKAASTSCVVQTEPYTIPPNKMSRIKKLLHDIKYNLQTSVSMTDYIHR